MALRDERFPTGISFHAVGGPAFFTDVVAVSAGIESRNRAWSQPRRRYEVSHAARLPAQWQPLRAFFINMGGRADSFRFKDWTDYSATAAEGKFTLLTSTTFQMYKRYTSGSLTFDSKITLPVTPSTITGGTVSAVDYLTGIVTMTSGTPTAWAGEFDIECRFDTDEMKAETIDKSGGQLVVGWSSIPLVEVRR